MLAKYNSFEYIHSIYDKLLDLIFKIYLKIELFPKFIRIVNPIYHYNAD